MKSHCFMCFMYNYQMSQQKKGPCILSINNCQEQSHSRDKRQKSISSFRSKQTFLLKPKLLAQPENALRSKKYTSSLVATSKQVLLDSLDIYQWRFQTEYPVVRAAWNGVLSNKTYPIIRDKKMIQSIALKTQGKIHNLYIEVQTEKVEPLRRYGPLTFPSFAYAFKQSLIGLERLFALFGPFLIDSKNIWVNLDGQVKVWFSSNYEQNSKQQILKQSQQTDPEQIMIIQLKQVFSELSQNTLIFRQFSKKIQGVSSFLSMLKILEDFVAKKKTLVTKNIRMPNSKVRRAASPIIRINFTEKGSPTVSPSKRQEILKQYSSKTGKYSTFTSSQMSGSSLRPKTSFPVSFHNLKGKDSRECNNFLDNLKKSKELVKKSFENKIQHESLIQFSNDSTPSSIISLTDESLKNGKEDCLKQDLDNLFQDESWLEDGHQSIKGLNAFGREINRSFYEERSYVEQ